MVVADTWHNIVSGNMLEDFWYTFERVAYSFAFATFAFSLASSAFFLSSAAFSLASNSAIFAAISLDFLRSFFSLVSADGMLISSLASSSKLGLRRGLFGRRSWFSLSDAAGLGDLDGRRFLCFLDLSLVLDLRFLGFASGEVGLWMVRLGGCGFGVSLVEGLGELTGCSSLL